MGHDEEKLSLFVEKAINDNIIEDGTLTNEKTKVNVCKMRYMFRSFFAKNCY